MQHINMSRKPGGIKKQVLGSMLCVLGVTVIVFDLMTANKPELFYIVLAASGCSLWIYGSLQNRK
jgi:hypothetical protein